MVCYAQCPIGVSCAPSCPSPSPPEEDCPSADCQECLDNRCFYVARTDLCFSECPPGDECTTDVDEYTTTGSCRRLSFGKLPRMFRQPLLLRSPNRSVFLGVPTWR